MKKYLKQVKKQTNDFQAKSFQIPREENKQASHLSKIAPAKHMLILSQVLSFVQISPLRDGVDVQEIVSKNNWTIPLISYLKNGMLLDDKKATRKLKVQAARFVLIKYVLYKRGFSHLYLRFLSSKEADYVMREIHKGVYKNHSVSRSLVHKLVKARYYWPTVQKDAQTYVKACEKC